MREMRAIEFVTRLIDEGALDAKKYNRMLHPLDPRRRGDDAARRRHQAQPRLGFPVPSARRRAAAGGWLEQNFDRVGREFSIDLAEIYL